MAPASKKLRKEELLRDMERLIYGCQGPVPDPGTELEVEDVTQRKLPTVTFHVASMKEWHVEDPEEMEIPEGKRENVNHDSSVHIEMCHNTTLRTMNTRNDDKVDA